MEASPRRELVISTAAGDDDMIAISVADTGAGIAPEVASQLFQPFITSKAHGMGVGLSICRTAIEFQKATLAAELDLRRAEVKQAEARLHELLAGSRSQEIEQAKAAVEAARTQQVQAAADWERAQILFRDDDISRSQFDQFKARYEGDAAALKQAEERLKLVMEGPRKEEIEAARALVERAAASVKLSEAARLEVTRKEQEVAARRAEVQRARAQIAVLDAQELTAQRQAAKAMVASLRSLVAQTRATEEQTVGETSSGVANARARLLAAQATLAQAQPASPPCAAFQGTT